MKYYREKSNAGNLQIALSTRWNAHRHRSCETMIQEILDAGFHHVELGYNIPRSWVPEIKRLVVENVIEVVSLHNFCPIPPMESRGHPELYTFAHDDPKVRKLALKYTSETIQFAAELGAKVVVLHCGNVPMSPLTPRLLEFFRTGKHVSNRYEKTKLHLRTMREKRVSSSLKFLLENLLHLRPLLLHHNIRLGLENLPFWESIPTERECASIIKKIGQDVLCYWHDMGHAQIREELGFSHHLRSLEELSPFLGGMHLHDVSTMLEDHQAPSSGIINFPSFSQFIRRDIPLVMEPSSRITSSTLQQAVVYLQEVWKNDHHPL